MHIVGTDIAGEVVSVGATVKDFAPGDKVVSFLNLNVSAARLQFVEHILALQ
jgi:NADPH:quinone reductase-like Zn-dependent oxidoreductase